MRLRRFFASAGLRNSTQRCKALGLCERGDEMQPLDQKFIATLIDRVDQDMKVWSVYANTHVGWCVGDLTSTVKLLQADGVPFFGPTRRADGVYQLYCELPYLHYIEIDALKYDAAATGVDATPWAEATKRATTVQGHALERRDVVDS